MDKRQSPRIQKIQQLLYSISIIGLFLCFIIYQCRQLRHEHRIRKTLNQVHQSLQNYHVKYEAYVPGPTLTLSELIFHLNKYGYMKEIPENPYTGKAYIKNDPDDHLRYQTDHLLETFKLEALDRTDQKVIQSMESTGLGKVKEDP